MKTLKFLLTWIALFIVMVFSWSIGFVAGNAITNTSPPPSDNTALSFYYFAGVCALNSLLLSALIWLTRKYSGLNRTILLVSFAFVIQFFLMQMESMFFGGSLGIQDLQVVSIVIAGFITSAATVVAGVFIVKSISPEQKKPFTIGVNNWRSFIVPFLLLSVIVYPIIYLTFGYYVAWQNENLRILYTKTSELDPFSQMVADSFTDGLYFFQILRAAIWVIVSAPLVIMLRHVKGHYFLIGLFSSVLPASQLFIPNPYMAYDIAMSHFVETASSNFIWGIVIAYAVDKYLATDESHVVDAKWGRTPI